MKYLLFILVLFGCTSTESKPRAPTIEDEQRCTLQARLDCVMGQEVDPQPAQCERDAFVHCMGSK